MILVFIAFFGTWNTLLLMLLAFVAVFATGIVLAILENRGTIEKRRTMEDEEYCHECDEERMHSKEPLSKRLAVCVPQNFLRITTDLGKYFLVGLLLAALVKAFIPSHAVVSYLGQQQGIYAVLLALPVSVLIEACSEGFAILTGQLFSMGSALAVVFVMTMVGVATDPTEVLVIWKKVGKRATVAYILVGTALTMLVAIFLPLFPV
jgi:uncharacterized membrane protein YraQ (UPF0718 family)